MVNDDLDADRTQSFVDLTVGANISHFKIINKIGAGGMGEVYLAEDTKLNRRVALKFLSAYLSSDEKYKARFRREAQAAAALDHKNIVTVYEVGEYGGRPFFSMQYVEGKSLSNILKTQPPSQQEAITLVTQICEGLSEAHQSGITHRDIKPSNVVVDSHGRPKLVDFGLATISGTERLTKSGAALGTVGYMAPETVRGELTDARSDIFSVGVLLYELITGRQPFLRVSNAATLHAIVYESPEEVAVLKPNVPDELQRIIDRALEKNPNTRYQSIDDFLNDLKTLEHAFNAGVRLPVAKPMRSRRSWLNTGLVGLLIVVGLVLMISLSSRRMILNWFGGDRLPDQPHLAVLPFTDIGEPIFGQAFSDGLMETLSSKLTQMEQFHGSLLVVPASDVRQQGVSSAKQARRTFGVNLAVSGSIQQFAEVVRMTLNLIDTKSERQLRASVIDYTLTDLTTLQDSIVIVLANMLQVHLRPEEEKVMRSDGTDTPEAYELYLRGQGYLQYADKLANVDTAIELFQQALDYDPDYTLALAGLGEAYWNKYSAKADPQWEELAVYNSRRALEVNDQVAQVYVTLGIIYNGTGRYEQAVEEFNQALSLDTTNRAAFEGLAKALVSSNMLDTAEAVYKKMISLRPNEWAAYAKLGFFYAYHGRYEDALEQAEQAVALEPDGYRAWNNIGGLFFALGEYYQSQEMWERSVEIDPNYGALSNLGAVYFMNGNFTKAAQKYGQALERNDYDYRIWFNFASALISTGENYRAREAYTKGIELAEIQRQINPHDPWLLAQLADAYASVGDSNKAVSLIDEALEFDPENVDIMVTAGSVLEQIGNRDRALSLIVDALKRGYSRNQIEPLPELRGLINDPRFDSMLIENALPASD